MTARLYMHLDNQHIYTIRDPQSQSDAHTELDFQQLPVCSFLQHNHCHHNMFLWAVGWRFAWIRGQMKSLMLYC